MGRENCCGALSGMLIAGITTDAVGCGVFVTAPGHLALLRGDRVTSLTRSLRVSNARFRGGTG
ncbi:MAG: hypothetical protein U5N53_15565 [Mycobacterium sp.]|nr:hypothetical protein [Mycobacterium sp.]